MISQPVLVQMPAQQYVPLQVASAPPVVSDSSTLLHHSHTQLISHHQQQSRQTRSGVTSGPHDDDSAGLSPPQQQQPQGTGLYEDYSTHYSNGQNVNTSGISYYTTSAGQYGVSGGVSSDYSSPYGGAETHTYVVVDNGATGQQVPQVPDAVSGPDMQILGQRIVAPVGQTVGPVGTPNSSGCSVRNDSDNVSFISIFPYLSVLDHSPSLSADGSEDILSVEDTGIIQQTCLFDLCLAIIFHRLANV